MCKYFVRYIVFWLPAALASYLLHGGGVVAVIQWFCAFFMVFGWAANTGMAAYEFPRSTISVLLAYCGISILTIMALYSVPYVSVSYRLLSMLGGLFSFKTLDIMVNAIIDLNLQHELYVTGFLVALCTVGYLAGLAYRRIRPNPYRPRIYKM